jgi:hypothetical protein
VEGLSYEALRRAIEQQRVQLALLPVDDPQRFPIYCNLIWCYHEAFALLYARVQERRKAAP